ncbi:MAG: efflux RND transporter periplasmic adaptor subunit [Gemmatimonadota bacterium]
MARIDFRRPAVWIPATLAILLVALMIFRAIEASAPAPQAASVEDIRAEQGVPVSVATVQRGPLAAWRTYTGTVSGAQEGVVRARSSDEVASVQVTVGTRVSRGQTLVRQTGESSAARVRQAQAALAQAERTVERLRPLHEAGAISDQDWEQALTQLELASADVAAAADVLTLTSPLAGVVTEVAARPGMIPSIGDPLVRVADLSELVVYLRVNASDVRDIREGQPARLGPTGPEGQVRRVALQADPVSRLVEVEVAFPPGAGLVPGTLATVQVQIASLEDVLHVPRAALSGDAIWVVGEGDVATRRSVQVQLEGADRVAIAAGLEAGERVVVSGGSLLSDGTRVQIVDAGTEVN